MYRLVVDAAAAEIGLGNASAVLLTDDRPVSMAALLTEESEATLAWLNEKGLPEADGYQAVLASLGYPDVEPAGRRLVRLVMERGWRSYGLLVDACNVVAARHAAGIGLHDVTAHLRSADTVAVWRAKGSETIVPAFHNSPRSIPQGDLVYGVLGAHKVEVLAWLGKRDVDAAHAQINDRTRAALIVALGHPKAGVEETMAVCREIADIVCEHQPTVRVTALRRD